MTEVDTRALSPPYRPSVHPQKVNAPLKPAPDLKYEAFNLDSQTFFEKDVAITMRDGMKLYANVYRPTSDLHEKTPSLVFFAPFGKHGAVPVSLFQNMGVDFGSLSKYTQWELPDPLLWCGQWGYSFVQVDPRGTWWSEGNYSHYLSPEEGRDGYDVVEWVAQQPWSTGKVGWGAVSYYAMSSYQTAALQPPHLAAIMPWEGISDIYREVNLPGGIPAVPFQHFWMNLTGNGLGQSEDHAVLNIEHPLFDEVWQSKVADWSRIVIPTFSVTGWSSLGLHLRGTIAAWKEISSEKKYLMVHGGREWSAYYSDEGVKKQKAFWDRFLKDIPNEVDDWAPVEIDVRTTAEQFVRRQHKNFPSSKTRIVPLFLEANELLRNQKTGTESTYSSYISHDSDSAVSFDYKFTKPTELTGYSSARLYVQAISYPDTDLYVAIKKIDEEGREVFFWNKTQKIDASAGLGWLRASHRELDPAKSVPERPYHSHQRRQWLRPSDIVEVQVEIWPMSTVWQEGETLRLVVQGTPFDDQEHPTQFRANRHNFGEVKIWHGGEYAAQLLIPVYGDESLDL